MTGRDGKHHPYWSDTEIKQLTDFYKELDAISFHIWGLN